MSQKKLKKKHCHDFGAFVFVNIANKKNASMDVT
jgi:hypothetical protein